MTCSTERFVISCFSRYSNSFCSNMHTPPPRLLGLQYEAARLYPVQLINDDFSGDNHASVIHSAVKFGDLSTNSSNKCCLLNILCMF